MKAGITLRPLAPDSWDAVLFRCNLAITAALLSIQLYAKTQRGAVWQDIQDWLWFPATLFGAVLVFGAYAMLTQKRRGLACAGLLAGALSAVLALCWVLVPRAIYD